MVQLAQLQAFFKKDRFANENGMVITNAVPGEATCLFVIEEKHCNAGGAIQGGAIFTLADFAFAVAANCGGTMTVSLQNNISFIAQPRGKKLLARACMRSETKRICFYDVEVTDEKNILVAKMSVTGYKKGDKINF